jgi:NAD(P)-dependent dehydrogenase (short-subunit alcohol dehydrogenase family)
MFIPKSILITGANAGIGFEFAKQMAQMEGVERIVLGCRSQDRAEAAKTALLEGTTSTSARIEILLLDVMDLDSVRDAVKNLKEPVEALVMNAGGLFGSTFADMTKYGVTVVCAANLLGHVALYDGLLESKKLTKAALYAGSEAARGEPPMLPALKLESGSYDEFRGICDGNFFAKPDMMAYYGGIKYVGALWMTSEAAKHPDLRLLTVSPGQTGGTQVMKTLPAPMRLALEWIVMPIQKALGMVHGVETGAGRYADVLTNDEAYESGKFYASVKGLTGDIGDQAELYNPDFANQDHASNANRAIHSFLTQ